LASVSGDLGRFIAVAVGQDEQSLSAHRISGFRRAENSDRNATAQSLQCWNGDGKLPVRVPRHVFSEESISPAGVEYVDCAVEQPSIVKFAKPLSGDTVSLARVSRSDNIHASTPSCAVKGSSVRPDRSWMKPPCFHRRDQACGCCCFPLQVADASASLSPMMEGKLQSEFESTDSCAN
jgi:hypothetical protein